MSKRYCNALFCTNRIPKKFSYCYDCAKRKGLIKGSNDSPLLFYVVIFLLVAYFLG